jgi:hypothetical protein
VLLLCAYVGKRGSCLTNHFYCLNHPSIIVVEIYIYIYNGRILHACVFFFSFNGGAFSHQVPPPSTFKKKSCNDFCMKRYRGDDKERPSRLAMIQNGLSFTSANVRESRVCIDPWFACHGSWSFLSFYFIYISPYFEVLKNRRRFFKFNKTENSGRKHIDHEPHGKPRNTPKLRNQRCS